MKRILSLIISLVILLCLTACTDNENSGRTSDDEPKTQDGKETQDLIDVITPVNFDNTYWSLTFGQTLGTQYVARFDGNGKILAFCSGSQQFSKGTYEYSNGKLIVSLGLFNNIELKQINSEFQSVKKYKMQVGEGYYTIKQTDNTYFLKKYEEYKAAEFENVKKVFPTYYIDVERDPTNDKFLYGKYKGFWVGIEKDEGYSYLTLREDQTFSISTNVDHDNHEIIDPVEFEGEYTIYRRQVIYPDDSTGYSTGITLYYGDYSLIHYEGGPDVFTDQSSGYEYIG